MKNFLEFIFENKSKVGLHFSPELVELLQKIKTNKVSDFLLDRNKESESESDVTFIDLTDKNDTVTFLPVNRLVKYADELGYKNLLGLYIKHRFTSRETEAWVKGRTPISIGRFTNKIYSDYNEKISSKELEEFVNLFKSTHDSILGGKISKFEFVTGEKIRYFYLEDNYEKEGGQLGNSCMRYDDSQEYLDIYVENPEVVSLLILKSQLPDKIVGRALIWKTTNNGLIMDRVYTTNDSDLKLFKEFAKSKEIKPAGDIVYGDFLKIRIKLKKWDFDAYPYLDSFKVLDLESRELMPEMDKKSKSLLALDGTEGYDFNDFRNTVHSDYEDERIPESEAKWIESIQDWVYEYRTVYIKSKNIYELEENCVFSKFHNDYIIESESVYSEFMDDHLIESEVLEVEDYDGDICKVPDSLENLVDIEVDGKKVKTLDIFTYLDSGKRVFYNLSVAKRETNFEEVKKKRVDKAIEKSTFEISEYEKLFYSSKHTLGEPLLGINLVEVVKFLLIHFRGYERYSSRKNAIEKEALNSESFEKLSEKSKLLLKRHIRPNSLYKLVSISRDLLPKVLPDKNLLLSYLKKDN